MARNLGDPWKYNLDGATQPLVVRGLVQDGSTQAIKSGELLNWNETSGYWAPVDAAADILYNLGFSEGEIDSDNAPAARYARIIIARPGDVFEIPLAAAAAVELGHNYEPTGTNSQTATLDADGDPVFCQVGQSNYPEAMKKGGTTVASIANGFFTMNKMYSYYKQMVRDGTTHMRVIGVTAATTLLEEWSGALIHNISATTDRQVDLPQNCPIGTFFRFVAGSANAMQVHSAGGGIIVKGGKQADSKICSVTDEGDFLHVVCVGVNDWLSFSNIGGADSEITVEG
jgi:hypothetical protein